MKTSAATSLSISIASGDKGSSSLVEEGDALSLALARGGVVLRLASPSCADDAGEGTVLVVEAVVEAVEAAVEAEVVGEVGGDSGGGAASCAAVDSPKLSSDWPRAWRGQGAPDLDLLDPYSSAAGTPGRTHRWGSRQETGGESGQKKNIEQIRQLWPSVDNG
jgi:hypothetical protein